MKIFYIPYIFLSLQLVQTVNIYKNAELKKKKEAKIQQCTLTFLNNSREIK